MRSVLSIFLLVIFVLETCSANEQPEIGSDFNPFTAFKNLQEYMAFIQSQSSDPKVASFLQEVKPESDIYDHVKAVMEQFAKERNNDIQYKSSVIIDQPNYPRNVNTYIIKDGQTLTCELKIGEAQTFTNFEDFTLECLGGQRFVRTKSAA
ncbi:hypothetical protein HA402_013688 [Bradysia odoriphaga]|nr:hypothetical protein HA402_013688 [Bradysia odoriphaga]